VIYREHRIMISSLLAPSSLAAIPSTDLQNYPFQGIGSNHALLRSS